MAAAALFLLALALVSVFVISRSRGRRNPSPPLTKLPPGPTKLPIIGNLHQVADALLHQSLWRLSAGNGGSRALPLMHLQIGRQPPTVVVSSAHFAEAFLKTHDLECCDRHTTAAASALSYGCSDVAFASYGARWREVRKICVAELFTSKKISSFRSIREEEVGRTLQSIRSAAAAGRGIDMRDELIGLTSSINCRAAFGAGSRSGRDERIRWFLRRIQPTFMQFFVADYFPAMGWVDELTGARGRLRDVFVELDRYYQQLIDEHLLSANQRWDGGSGGGGDLLDALLCVRREGYITDEHVKGTMMNIFIAGSDTSAAGVEWAMAELMRHPEIMKRAQAEVRGHVGGGKGRVEEGDLHVLHYLKSVVKETLRLHPPVPLLVQRETSQHVKLGEYSIPPGAIVTVNVWAIGRDPNSWERPEEFDPERFVSSGGGGGGGGGAAAVAGGQEFKFIPFGEGRRICPAKNSAMLTMELVLANLLYCFDWGLPEGMKKEDISSEEAPGITVHRRSPLFLVPGEPVKLESRDVFGHS